MSTPNPHLQAGPALLVEVEQTLPMPLHGSLHCEAGELLALVGPSGAGKTSLLRVLAGLMRPRRGRVVVGGEVWCDTANNVFLPPQRRHVGLVFQNCALMPHLDALGNVALSLLHFSPAVRRDRARHWLDHVGLHGELQARRPSALSGGQQQRVAVARALAREPRLLLLDEPFSAVNQMNRQGLYRLLADLRRELAIPIVLVTHDLNEARMLADRLVVMDAGQVLQQGTPAHIHNAPRNARVADLVGIQNRFRGEWQCKMQSPEGWKTPRIELDSGLFTVRAATRPRQMGRAARQSGVRASPVEIRLGGGVGPSLVLRPQSPSVPPRIVRLFRAFMLGGDGSKS